MKNLTKVLAVLIVLVMTLSLVPVLEAPASAASTPILVLSSTTAVNPILDHVLTNADFATGGPHTITFEWRAVNIKDNDASDPGAGHAFVGITGTAYGQASGENTVTGKPAGIKGTTNWASVTMTFGNVGVYGISGTNYPGNILRFGMWKAKGELQIRNLVIKTGSTVKYDLNADSVVAQAVANTEAMGMTECDLSELAAIDFENCPWNAGQFSTGAYSSSIKLEAGSAPTESSVTRPTTTKQTTTSSTTKQTTTASTTKQPTSSSSSSATTTAKPTTKPATKPTTTKPTTKAPEGHNCNTQGHQFASGYCVYCGASDPNYNPCANGHSFENGWCMICLAQDPTYNPCANGHTFENGYCVNCLAQDPNATTQPTQAPQTTPTTPSTTGTSDEGGLSTTWLIVFVMVFAVGICVVVLYATGVFSKKK